MINWLDLLKIIGGGGNTPPLINEGLNALPKLFMLRKTQDDLLREQNRLLGLLLAKQTAEPTAQLAQQAVYVQGTTPASAAAPNTTPDFEIDEIPYIPKIIKGESSISSVDTSKSKFDPEEVEKLKQARAKALKDHPQD